MNVRILAPEEWAKLSVEGGLPALLPFVEPQNIAIVVVENDAGKIVASVAAMQVTHFEGLWIAPEERGNAGVFRSLIRQAYALPRARGEHWVFGGAGRGDERMETLCHRLGGRMLAMKLYALPVGSE